MTAVNLVLKIAEAGSFRVALAGGAFFEKVNGKSNETRVCNSKGKCDSSKCHSPIFKT